MAVSVETQTSELAARIEQYRNLARSGSGGNEVVDKLHKNLHSLMPIVTALGDKYDKNDDGFFETGKRGRVRLKTETVSNSGDDKRVDGNQSTKSRSRTSGENFFNKKRSAGDIALFEMYLAGYAGLAVLFFAFYGRI